MSKKTEEEFPPIELIYSVSKEESWEWICAQLDHSTEAPKKKSSSEEPPFELPLDKFPTE